jgi:hypothetical protein
MRRSFYSLILAFAALTACGGDGGGGNDPQVSLPGTYSLSTVDGQAVPYILFQDATLKLEAKNGTFTITGSGTYTENITLRFTDANGVEEIPAICSGTYTKSGNNLTITETETDVCGGSWTATWDGRNTITIDYGLLVVYKR